MMQVLPNRKGPSFSEKINSGLGAGLEMGNQLMQANEAKKQEVQRTKKLSELTGMDLTGLPQEVQQKAFESAMQRQMQQEKYGFEAEKAGQKLKGEQEANIAPLQGAMDTLNRMKGLRKKGNLGIGSTYSPYGNTRKEAGEYEQLGKSLIQYATNIPIRNRIEFETLAENLYDPTTTDAKAEGILNAMERIISNSLQAAGYEGEENTNPSSRSIGAKKRSLDSFKIGAK